MTEWNNTETSGFTTLLGSQKQLYKLPLNAINLVKWVEDDSKTDYGGVPRLILTRVEAERSGGVGVVDAPLTADDLVSLQRVPLLTRDCHSGTVDNGVVRVSEEVVLQERSFTCFWGEFTK